MATVTVDIDSQIPLVTRVAVQGFITASTLSRQKAYVITDAVASTKAIIVFATANNALSPLALNLTDGTFGTYNIGTDVYTATAGGSFVPYEGAIANVDLGANLLRARALEVATSGSIAGAVGRFVWNDSDGTIEFRLKGNNVTLQLGQEQVARVVNGTGANLLEAEYRCVYVSGAQGQRMEVGLAQANTAATSENILGIVTEDINNNQQGFVTTQGLVNNINTTGSLQSETWADGDVLFLSQTTAGAITNIEPTSGIRCIVGYCVYAHNTQGKIYVHPQFMDGADFIPLSGTEAGRPVTGDVEVAVGTKFFHVNGDGVRSEIEFANERVYIRVDDPVNGLSQIDLANGGCRVSFEDGAEGITYNGNFWNSFQLRSLIDLGALKRVIWAKAGTWTVNDDLTQGFVVGSLLWDTTNSILYRATSVATGAANWVVAINADSSPILSLVSTPATNVPQNLIRFIPVGGSNAPSAGSGSYTGVVPRPLTTVNASCNLVFTGSTVGVSTITLFRNGVATSLVITIPTGSTQGVYSFAAAVAYNTNDTWVWEIRSPSGSAIQVNNVVLNYE